MSRHGQVFENPVTGERAIVITDPLDHPEGVLVAELHVAPDRPGRGLKPTYPSTSPPIWSSSPIRRLWRCSDRTVDSVSAADRRERSTVRIRVPFPPPSTGSRNSSHPKHHSSERLFAHARWLVEHLTS